MPLTEAELKWLEQRSAQWEEYPKQQYPCSWRELDLLLKTIRELQAQLEAKPQRKSKKKQVEEALRESDLSAQLSGRDNIDYGHHETLPRGEHVAREGFQVKKRNG